MKKGLASQLCDQFQLVEQDWGGVSQRRYIYPTPIPDPLLDQFISPSDAGGEGEPAVRPVASLEQDGGRVRPASAHLPNTSHFAHPSAGPVHPRRGSTV